MSSALALVDGAPDVGQEGGRREVDHQGRAVAQGGVELVEGAGERTVVVCARDRQDRAAGGREGEPLGRGEPPRPSQLLGEERRDRRVGDHDLHEGVGRVGRQPAAGRQLQLADELVRAQPEAPGHLLDRRLAHPGQPADDGKQPAQAQARVEGTRGVPGRLGRLRHRGAAPSPLAGGRRGRGLGPTDDGLEPGHQRARVRAAGRAPRAWSRSPSSQERSAAGLATPRRRTTEPSARRSCTAASPTSSTTRPASIASTRTMTSSASSAPTRHGSSGASPATSNPSGSAPLPGSPTWGRSSMRSTRNVLGASRAASHPTAYQRPWRNHRPPGARSRRSPR